MGNKSTELQYLEDLHWFNFNNESNGNLKDDLTRLIVFDSICNGGAALNHIPECKSFDEALSHLRNSDFFHKDNAK
jgi:hypothetical protein